MSPEQLAVKLQRMALDKRRLMQRIVIAVEAGAKMKAPVKTGTLRRSITHRVVSPEMGIVGTNVLYARPVHEGAKPHEIKPLNKKALFWPGAPGPRKKVNHPGQRGQPFLKQGLDLARPRIHQLLQEAGEEMFAEVV